MLCIIIAYLHLGGSSCEEFFNGIFLALSLTHSVRIVFFTVNIFYARAMTVTTTRVIMHARVQCVCIFSSFFFYTYIVAVVIHEHRLSISAAASIDCSPLCATMECVNPISSIVWTRARDTQ